MKKLLFLVFLLMHFLSNAQDTAIPDRNFEQALIALGYDSGAPDRKVITANVTLITILDVSNRGIEDLTGIEDFKSLANLNCSGNILSRLDLSQNRALNNLTCSKNQISSLNLTNNPVLTELNCEQNAIGDLDLTQNRALRILNCIDNRIISLDLTKNTALTKLNCERNKISNLDLTKNSALLELFCFENEISNLNLTQNWALKVLSCGLNQLTSLNVSNNKLLTRLQCPRNQITDLNLTQNIVLIELGCIFNQLTSLDISKNTALTSLDCSNNSKLTSLNLKNTNNRILTTLDLKNNPNLTCIQVDDPSYSDTNWSSKKDATASFALNCEPVVSAVGDQTYCAGIPQKIATDFNITDFEDTGTMAIYIQISSGYVNGQDVLTLANLGSHLVIKTAWDATAGKLTLSSSSLTPGTLVSYSDFIAAVKDVEFSTSSPNPTGMRTFSISIGSANYLPSTGHYYEFVPDFGVPWTTAKTKAEARKYYGLTGYLATLLTLEEALIAGAQTEEAGWIGGTDNLTPDQWRWVTGPEGLTNNGNGVVFWNGRGNGSSPPPVNFAYWNTGEPNNDNLLFGENYAHINPSTTGGIAGSWNDLSVYGAFSGPYQPKGYIVEYGGMPLDGPTPTISAWTKMTMSQLTVTTPAPICSGETTTLQATAASGTITWYDLASGGTPLQTDTSPSSFTTPVLTVSTTYYIDNGCSARIPVVVTVNPNVTPTFTQVAAICPGGNLSPLPSTSTNGIAGTWSPALDNIATTTYTFTPIAGQCATTATMTIMINTIVIPTFTQVAAICQGGNLSPLPLTSTNGITGTWSPALDNTATRTYTFTPDSGQCATTATMSIAVNTTPTVPTFAPVAAVCAGGSFSPLPLTSTNGITGTWLPALNNTTTTTYTFTPNVGQCATTTTMTVAVNGNVTPTFTPVAAICLGGNLSPLPLTSSNGITGTWTPALDNTATTTYTFTPNVGQCGTTTTMTIIVNTTPTIPTFTPVTAICAGGSLTALPLTSNNGITGSWSPVLNTSATTTYTFTPTTGQCATTATMTITVNANATPTFTQVAAICVGGNLTALPLTSNNGITGTWSPVLNTATTTTYTFTPTTGQCATTAIMTITVNAIPTAPTTTPVSYFIGDVATALSATGTNLLWYTTATGGTGSPVAPTPNTSTAGTITYYVTQTNVNNCESLRASLLVTISALPGMPITSPASYCVGDIAIPLTATGTNLLWYTTAIGGLGSPTAPTPITTTARSTSYYVTQTAANGFESARASLLVTVNPIPTAPRITTTTATTFCAGGSVTLTSTAANGNQWYKDNILIIGQTGTTYVATTSGAYTVISTQVGCPSPPSAGITVTVNTVPTPTITATMPTTFCTGGSVILTSNALNGNQWYKDNVLISGETGTTYSATASGTYTVISTISGCPSAASSGIVVNVIASNVASFTVDVVDLTDVNTVTVNATGPGVYQYSLDEPTGPFQDSNLFTNVPAGIHTVYVDDKNGCGTVNKEIALLGLPKFFTPNGDGYNDYWSVKGVNETYNSKSIIYIFNRYGKLLHQWIPASSKGWDGTYNGDTLPVDDYWYRIKLEDGREAKGHFSLKR